LSFSNQSFKLSQLTSSLALAAPQSVIKTIRNLQRNFLWHGHHPDKKWALVGWDKICRPKSIGGLGLRDPSKLNNIMGAKLWWHWLKHPTELWARMWKHKYAPHTNEDLLIRYNTRSKAPTYGMQPGNLPLIQKHAFWEIRNGEMTLFWHDSWQQLSTSAL
jgi:hypothetical protein